MSNFEFTEEDAQFMPKLGQQLPLEDNLDVDIELDDTAYWRASGYPSRDDRRVLDLYPEINMGDVEQQDTRLVQAFRDMRNPKETSGLDPNDPSNSNSKLNWGHPDYVRNQSSATKWIKVTVGLLAATFAGGWAANELVGNGSGECDLTPNSGYEIVQEELQDLQSRSIEITQDNVDDIAVRSRETIVKHGNCGNYEQQAVFNSVFTELRKETGKTPNIPNSVRNRELPRGLGD